MKFTNPLLWGDYSDPDVICARGKYYMISSSFTYLPGIPVLESGDLVNWHIAGHAASRLPFDRYDVPVHKCGTWAPSLRYHNGTFYVYVCLPDEGLFAFTAKEPSDEWECHWVKDVCGWIDPCPLFDEDGSAYLLHGLAASRAGINNMLFLHRMSPDGFTILDKGELVYNGSAVGDTTVEGPKMYRINGKYFILCPAGGVPTGYQLALRSDSPYGPYERKVVLAQGSTDINGPHQGGLFTDVNGRDWFIHFRDVGVYGRVPYLEPVTWTDGWPVMGINGEPVKEGDTGHEPCGNARAPLMSDDFKGRLSLSWQWQANPRGEWYEINESGLRLYAAESRTLFEAGQFLSQLMQATDFDMDVKLSVNSIPGVCAGVGMMGYSYGYCAIKDGQIICVSGRAQEHPERKPITVNENVVAIKPLDGNSAVLRMSVKDGKYTFLADTGSGFAPLGPEFSMSPGGWTGARPGIFALNASGLKGGYAEFEYCRVSADGKLI